MTLTSALALVIGSTVRFTTNGVTGYRTGTIWQLPNLTTGLTGVQWVDNEGQVNRDMHNYSQLT